MCGVILPHQLQQSREDTLGLEYIFIMAGPGQTRITSTKTTLIPRNNNTLPRPSYMAQLYGMWHDTQTPQSPKGGFVFTLVLTLFLAVRYREQCLKVLSSMI